MPRWNLSHDTITDGDAVGVLLSNRPVRAWVCAEDYGRIVAAHGFRGWKWSERGRFVFLRASPKQSVPVARLVLESDGTGFVHYRNDDDRLNLRRAALWIDARRKPYRTRKMKVRTIANQAAVDEQSSPPSRTRKGNRPAPMARQIMPPTPLRVRPRIVSSQAISVQRKAITAVQLVKRSSL